MQRLVRCHWLFWGPFIIAGVTHAQDPAPPEVAKTIDALRGHWVLTGTDSEPGAQSPAKVDATIDCEVVALGAAVNCLISADVQGLGSIAAAAVIGYSPDERLVRWMEISSTGEYHDHKGKWQDSTIDFEPLPYTVGGQSATENLRIAFPVPGRLVLNAVTETADGKSILSCTGTRK